MVSANLGLTIRSCRQAVLEARLALDWLQTRGYRRIALIGASLGTAIGSVVASHDSRINAVALLSLASDFGQVVWTSRATRHIRQAIEEDLTAEQLAEIWSLFSPIHYVHSLAAQNIPVFAVSGREDAVFQPHLTEELLRAYRTHGVRYERQVLPCGHYTMGSPPFSYLMLWSLQRFLKRELGASQDSNKVAKDLATPTASGSGPTRNAA
jgi:pimeloyl-ACP methyl ester carboxylesterase